MTDLLITQVGDAWVHAGRPGLNTGSTRWVQVKSGERIGLLWPRLQTIAGRTVLAAPLYGRVGPGHVAQTYTVAPITERWSPGRVRWDNQPTINAGAAFTVSVGALADGDLVEFDLESILSAVAAGTEWFGVQITTDSTAAGQLFYATDSGEPAWELHVTLSDTPEQPSSLRPNAGAVTTVTPILAWDPVDLGGTSTEQAEFEIQVDTPGVGVEPDEVTPDFYETWTVSGDPQFDLATSGHTPAGDGPHYWRVRTKDTVGVESEWSDWADYTVAALPTPVTDSPVGPFGDPSPTLTAHTVEGEDVWWRAWATGPDRSDIRDESGLQAGPLGVISWQVPERNADGRRVLREDEAGWIHYRVGDNVTRAIAVGENPWVDVWIPVEFDEDLGVEAPTWLTVNQLAPGDPRNVWTWARTEAADAWLLQTTGGVTIARLEPEDVTADTGVYSWTDDGRVQPLRPQDLSVRAIEGDAKSPAVTKTDHVHVVKGMWLIPEDEDPIVLEGTAVGDFVRTDRVATFTPLVGPEVDVIYDYTGRTGAFRGVARDPKTVWTTLDRVEALRKSRRRTVRMVWGSQSITARIADPDSTSADDITPKNPRHNVRFRFVQVGD